MRALSVALYGLLGGLLGGLLAYPAFPAHAADFSDVKVTATHVSGTVHMLQGAGGNIAVTVGEDGTLIVDNQFAPLAPKIQTAIDALGGAAPRFVLNTHYHGDHTGGNATFGKAGTIIAHDNVRVRLLNESDDRNALPLITYDQGLSIHVNGETIKVIHLPGGHTDGDSLVWFQHANVIHLGDHFFNGTFPYIDINGGGSVDGLIANLEHVLTLVPEDIRIIPGHGPLGNVVQLAEHIDMLKATTALVRNGLDRGDSAETITAALEEKYAAFGQGFISSARWVQIHEADRAGPDHTENTRSR